MPSTSNRRRPTPPLLKTSLIVLVAIFATTFVAISGCTAILGDFEVGGAATGEGGAGGKQLGEACVAAADCASGSCADSVCCESACNGTCESCNLPTLAGKCMPVPDGQDPQNECPTTPLPDAGALPEEDAGIIFEPDGGDEDAGDASAAPDTGPGFTVPDAGIVTEHNQCAGKCNGKRACGYPSTERTCGSIFCGNTTEQGRAACDGKGHCLFGVETCEAYACPDGKPGCVKTCTSESDCLPTHFCDAQSSSCKPKLQNGSGCNSVTQCTSGFCAGNVCCNDECNGFPGASCTVPGNVGTCRCDACPTGACQLYFRDEDNDKFGDKFGTVLNGRAVPGCVTGPAPAGFVANKTDCFDGPNPIHGSVRPNQTSYFKDSFPKPPSGLPSWDYDCDDQEEKSVPQYINGSCRFCRKSIFNTCAYSTTTCTNGESAGLSCSSTALCKKGEICATTCKTSGTTTAFTFDVKCGDTRLATNCGYCSANKIVGTTNPSTTQLCR